jgi:hypothetical protein
MSVGLGRNGVLEEFDLRAAKPMPSVRAAKKWPRRRPLEQNFVAAL